MKYYLAVDIGASSGRHILGSYQNGKLVLEEIHRFENNIRVIDEHLSWDVDYLFHEIIVGMKKCKELDKIPLSMAIDTWAVDYIFLDRHGKRIGNAISYRDHRTDNIDQEVYKIVSAEELYERTGIQKQLFNTLYQLMAVKKYTPEILTQVSSMLMIPDYFSYLLTGRQVCEYTNASTTQLVSSNTRNWDRELIEQLGYPQTMFKEIIEPGTIIGNLTDIVQESVGFDTKVIATASHDTASAVVSVPALREDFIYISSGTWSLMGMERNIADCSLESMQANFTNEGGYNHRFRYLKNIMGLWMIQSLRRELEETLSFNELCQMAKANQNFPSRVDVNDCCFLSPDSMIKAIQDYCQNSNQPIPKTAGELANVIYQSLAISYAATIEEIEMLTRKKYEAIYIVGGGGNAEYLNELTAKATGKVIYTGPVEATATGNIVVQMLNNQVFASLVEARKCIKNSFEIKKYKEEK